MERLEMHRCLALMEELRQTATLTHAVLVATVLSSSSQIMLSTYTYHKDLGKMKSVPIASVATLATDLNG